MSQLRSRSESSNIVAACIALVALAPAHARAQPPTPATPVVMTPGDSTIDSTSADALLARLQRAEEAIALLRQQLAAQAASATQTESRVRFDIGGRVLVNGFYNTWRVNNTDVPQFARPDTNAPGRLLRGGVGAAVRQTSLRGSVIVPEMLGGAFTGDLDVDFYGGQQASPGGRSFPLLRIRTVRGVLRWRDAELLFGQDVPPILAIDPVSVAAIGVPEFGTAGNLWLWLPQVRLLVERGAGPVKLGVLGAVLAPTNGDPAGLFDTGVDLAERAKRPMLQARVQARWGPDDDGGEIGVGVHRGWLAATTNDSTITSAAIAANLVVPIRWLELRAEAFSGRALRGLGGGGIAQGVNARGAPIDTKGGWAQLNVRLRSLVTLGAGCGVDQPDGEDLPTPNVAAIAATRLRNAVCEGHVIARPDGPLVVGTTFRYIRTRYANPIGPVYDRHYNLTVGYAF